MKHTFKLLMAVITLLTTFNSLAQSNAAAIQKRWMAVDVVGNKEKKERYASRFAKHTSEMEFRAGKFIMYQDGVIDGSATYIMASDGKSVLIKEGQTEMSLKIISLKGNTLQAVASGFMSSKDTIIYQYGSGVKPLLATKANWEKVASRWANVITQYQRRSDLVKNLIQLLKSDSSMDKKVITELEDARNGTDKVATLTSDKLTAASVKEFQEKQMALSGAISKAIVRAEYSATLKANSNWNSIMAGFENNENSINVERNNYNNEVMNYNNLEKKNKGKVKDISFKADAGPDKAPEVKF